MMSAQTDPEKAQQPHATSPAASTYSDEKGHASQVERVSAEGGARAEEKVETPLYNAHIDVSEVDEKKLLRKLDWYLVPWLSFLYLLSFLDRTSIGNAKVGAYSSCGCERCEYGADTGASSCIISRRTCTLRTSNISLH